MECGVSSLLDTIYYNIVFFFKGNLYFDFTIYRIYIFFLLLKLTQVYLVSLQRFIIIRVEQTKEGCIAFLTYRLSVLVIYALL